MVGDRVVWRGFVEDGFVVWDDVANVCDLHATADLAMEFFGDLSSPELALFYLWARAVPTSRDPL